MLGTISLLRKPPVEVAKIAVETLVFAVCLIIVGFFFTHVPLLSPERTDFVRRKKGRIMIVSSITAAAPNPTIAVYAASKSYLTRYVRCQFLPLWLLYLCRQFVSLPVFRRVVCEFDSSWICFEQSGF